MNILKDFIVGLLAALILFMWKVPFPSVLWLILDIILIIIFQSIYWWYIDLE